MIDRTGPTQSLSARELPVEPVDLVAVIGPGAGARCRLTAGTAVAGSSRRSELHLQDGAVSRQHASFELLPGAVRVRDLGSRNGTRWLSGRVDSAIVPIGTRLTLGKTVVEVRPVAPAPRATRVSVEGLVAESQAMQALLARLARVAPTPATVVLWGPTGAGKEAVARALHRLSGREKGPFEIFDAAAVGEQLLESELFGHRRGAFTGAVSDHVGAAERAAGGTLLLDHVDQLPAAAQTRLLRFLEERTTRRLGEGRERRVDVRVVATAQAPLESAVREGTLRPDVFYRLAEVVLEVPALRDRLEDVVPLARRFAREHARLDVELSPATLAALQAHPWPGNVRELKNAVVRAVALGSVDLEVAAPRVGAASRADLKQARGRVLEAFEADFLRALLRQHRWNVAAAARDAKIARSHFYTLLSRHGISRG